MSGGGGDDYSARAAQIEAKKQQARDRLNVSFGVQPTGGAPSRDQFVIPAQPVEFSETAGPADLRDGFDQAGFDRGQADFEASKVDAARNATARDALYGTVRQNAFDAGRRGLDEKRTRAARDTKFALFAQGLNGGSVDVDENATLGRTYDQGLLDLGAKADSARTDFRSNDEQTRLGLLQSIDAGMDQGSVLSSALSQLQSNSDRAASSAQGTALGDLFADAGLLYTKSNAARGRAQAGEDWNSYGSSMRGRGGNNGIVTQTGP